MRYLMKVSYDGSGFYGFQRLNDYRTVQKVLEEALGVINKGEVLVKGASRTDKGVHAYGQMIHFDIDYDIPADRLMYAVNRILDNDIRVLDCKKVGNDFHARFNVKRKKYVYKINLGDFDCLKSRYFLQVYEKLDIDKMRECAKVFLGCHDFRNFVAGERDNYLMCVEDIKFNMNNDILEIEFLGKSFYRYMVRNMVGAMLEVGMHKKEICDVSKMLDDYMIKKQMMTAPACGLYLMDIEY
ncbi:tRNA pseudouridine synthase A [Coprobacillus sp. CAG:605]|jgi:tRNA pseudouridine38-40 synthase|nr:tRNA pseudouridine synthase A [Coprobacillus sp. CAG:605]